MSQTSFNYLTINLKIMAKDISNEKEATLHEMLDYLCSKVNWGNSFLDNTAVVCMNNLFTHLKKDTKKYPL